MNHGFGHWDIRYKLDPLKQGSGVYDQKRQYSELHIVARTFASHIYFGLIAFAGSLVTCYFPQHNATALLF